MSLVDIEKELEKQIETIRRFNRGYMLKIGMFAEKIFDNPVAMSITEVRLMHELSLQTQTTATHLSKVMKVDGGYLSRILNKFEKAGLISKLRSVKDARERKISLTPKGKKTWAAMSAKANENVHGMISSLSGQQKCELITAMASISVLLGLD